jgi:hypothetical protein
VAVVIGPGPIPALAASVADRPWLYLDLEAIYRYLSILHDIDPDAWALVVGLRRVSSPFEAYEAEDGEMAIRGRSDLWERACEVREVLP